MPKDSRDEPSGPSSSPRPPGGTATASDSPSVTGGAPSGSGGNGTVNDPKSPSQAKRPSPPGGGRPHTPGTQAKSGQKPSDGASGGAPGKPGGSGSGSGSGASGGSAGSDGSEGAKPTAANPELVPSRAPSPGPPAPHNPMFTKPAPGRTGPVRPVPQKPDAKAPAKPQGKPPAKPPAGKGGGPAKGASPSRVTPSGGPAGGKPPVKATAGPMTSPRGLSLVPDPDAPPKGANGDAAKPAGKGGDAGPATPKDAGKPAAKGGPGAESPAPKGGDGRPAAGTTAKGSSSPTDVPKGAPLRVVPPSGGWSGGAAAASGAAGAAGDAAAQAGSAAGSAGTAGAAAKAGARKPSGKGKRDDATTSGPATSSPATTQVPRPGAKTGGDQAARPGTKGDDAEPGGSKPGAAGTAKPGAAPSGKGGGPSGEDGDRSGAGGRSGKGGPSLTPPAAARKAPGAPASPAEGLRPTAFSASPPVAPAGPVPPASKPLPDFPLITGARPDDDEAMAPVVVGPDEPFDREGLFSGSPGPVDPSSGEGGAQGRHVNGGDRPWGWVAGWTVLGALLPGVGLIAAGRRRVGGVILGLAMLVPVLIALTLWRYGAVDSAIQLGTDQTMLIVLMVLVPLTALVLCGVVVATNRALLRRSSVDHWTRGANALVVLALLAAIGIPAGYGTDYLRITHSTVGSVFDNDSDSSTRPNSEASDPWDGIPRVNLLLIGSDAEDDREGVRTDSMILASINTKTGDTTLLSPPRNLQRAPFDKDSAAYKAWPHGFGNTRGTPWPRSAAACGAECDLSAVWGWGVANRKEYYKGVKNPGAMALREAIEGIFGLKVDAHLVVDLEGFKAVVDALGGLTVDVHERLPIGGTTANPITGKWINKGLNQKLDGYEALWFARSRSLSSDYDRMARQRCVIGAVVEQADPVNLIRSYPGLAKAAGDNINTDIDSDDLDAWVELGLKIKDGQVRSLPFTDKVISYGHPDYKEIRSLVRNSLKPPKSTPVVTPSPGTDGEGTTPTPKPGKNTEGKGGKNDPKAPDPTKAQDVKEVC